MRSLTKKVRIDYSRKFVKALKRAPRQVQIAFRDRLQVFCKDKFHPSLNNHHLSGELKGYRSINVTGDWRAVFREWQSGKVVYFEILGTHSQLYK